MASLLQDQVDHPEQPLSPNRNANKDKGRGEGRTSSPRSSRVLYGASLMSPNSAIAKAISDSEGTVARMNEQKDINIRRRINNERLQKARDQEVCTQARLYCIF